MKKRIIYLIGTIVFLAVLAFTVQLVEYGADENNILTVKNLEALAGGTFYCTNNCYADVGGCCPWCFDCQPKNDSRPANPVLTCTQEPE